MPIQWERWRVSRVRLRVDFDNAGQLGPGKVRLMELIAETGSISAAGRAMDMSYRRAWLLVDSLNRCFKQPLVLTQLGGSGGGGALLSEFGQQVVASYRAMERDATAAVAAQLTLLEQALAPPAEPPAP